MSMSTPSSSATGSSATQSEVRGSPTDVAMSVAVLAKRSPSSGNLSTADRIGRHLYNAGYSVVHINASEGDGSSDGDRSHGVESVCLRSGVFDSLSKVACAVGLHAHHAGKWLVKSKTPYVLVLGGTDVYSPEYQAQPELDLMRAAAHGAFAVVAFTDDMRDAASSLFGLDPSTLRVIPQAVYQVSPKVDFSVADLDVWAGSPVPRYIYLLPAGLRPVKDVLFLASAFGQWHADDPEVALLIVGHGADEDYADHVRAVARVNAGVYVSPALPQDCLFRALTQCSAVVNTSVSEGMCGVLVEAMFYDCPILARRNAGNSAIIAHEVNGLLFDTPAEFVALAKRLRKNDELRAKIVQSARHTAETKHSPEVEAQQYVDLVHQLLQSRRHETPR